MLTFTKLEQAVLNAICERYRADFPSLPELLANAQVLGRQNTGHGFYTDFRTDPIDTKLIGPQPISGPDARMIGMGEDALMGFLLWCSPAGPSQLEGFQYGDANGDQVDLKTKDLAELRFAGLDWA